MATSPYGNLMNLRSITGPAGGGLGSAPAGGGIPSRAVGPQPAGGIQSGGWGGIPYGGGQPPGTGMSGYGGMQVPGSGMGGAYGGGVLPFHAVGPQPVSPYPISGGSSFQPMSGFQSNPVQGAMGSLNLGGYGGGYGHPVGPQPAPGGIYGMNSGGPGYRAVGPEPAGGQNYANLLMLSRMGY